MGDTGTDLRKRVGRRKGDFWICALADLCLPSSQGSFPCPNGRPRQPRSKLRIPSSNQAISHTRTFVPHRPAEYQQNLFPRSNSLSPSRFAILNRRSVLQNNSSWFLAGCQQRGRSKRKLAVSPCVCAIFVGGSNHPFLRFSLWLARKIANLPIDASRSSTLLFSPASPWTNPVIRASPVSLALLSSFSNAST